MADTVDTLVANFTDTFITHDSGEVPYKLMKIFVSRIENLESVADDIANLNDIDNLTGKSLELEAEKWNIFRRGQTDAELLVSLKNRIFVFYYSSALPDLLDVLEQFSAPNGSLLEVFDYQDAEIDVYLNAATTEVFDRIKDVLERVKAAGIELDMYNVLDTGDALLYEDDGIILYEDGDKILLD